MNALSLTTRFARLTVRASTQRTFTTLIPHRPRLSLPRSSTPTTSFTPAEACSLDIVPKTSITAHPALQATSIRCGPRNTMNGHTRLLQKRRHGWLKRRRSKSGRRILLRRRVKGRRDVAD